MGLYNGLGAQDIHARKGLKRGEQILDHMGSTELAANLFRSKRRRRSRIRRSEGESVMTMGTPARLSGSIGTPVALVTFVRLRRSCSSGRPIRPRLAGRHGVCPDRDRCPPFQDAADDGKSARPRAGLVGIAGDGSNRAGQRCGEVVPRRDGAASTRAEARARYDAVGDLAQRSRHVATNAECGADFTIFAEFTCLGPAAAPLVE